MMLVCPDCETRIAKTGIEKHWEKSDLLQTAVEKDRLRRELAKRIPYIECPSCEDGILVPERYRSDEIGEDSEPRSASDSNDTQWFGQWTE